MGKILLTGTNGFIGKALLSFLSSQVSERKNDLLLLSSQVSSKYLTLLYDTQYNIPEIHGLDGVIHIGGFIPKDAKDANNIDGCFSNILFTRNLLKSLAGSINHFVFISTIDVYDNNEKVITENSLVNPCSLYGWSKLYCEKMVSEWCQGNQVPYKILRLGHIYGTGEGTYKKIIPVTIQKVMNNETPIIFTKGEEKRCFLNIHDCVRFIWKAYASNSQEKLINIVSDRSNSMIEIINEIISISKKNIVPDILNKPIPTKDYNFDNSLMRKLCGDEQVTLYDGLKEEYEYFSSLRK